jgi:acyl dehydratase
MSPPDFAAIDVGQALPPLDIPVSVRSIVATAMATRDFQDVHHDPDRARELGSENVFMNILASNGYVERYVGEWAGPNALIRAISIRLGAPNYPGDLMRMSGEVTARDAQARTLTVSVVGRNSRGAHVTGTVNLHYPEVGR